MMEAAVLVLMLTLAHATCTTSTGGPVAMTTPDTVPPNAELVITTHRSDRSYPKLLDSKGLAVDGAVLVEAGHVVWIPDELLPPGTYELTAEGQRWPVVVEGEPDLTAPPPPVVDSSVRVKQDTTHGGPSDKTTIRLASIPPGSHAEYELTPDDGGAVIFAATDEYSVTMGYRMCDYNWPDGFNIDLTYAIPSGPSRCARKPAWNLTCCAA